jgi:hypothetical protein
MWVKDIDGDLVNLAQCVSVYMEKDGDTSQIFTNSIGDDFFTFILFRGTEEGCREKMSELATHLTGR